MQLRDVHVSMALMEEFLAYAASNTKRGIESCGILAGRLQANDSIFNITTLIIPKQSGTSDTVQALNEEEIFDVQVCLASQHVFSVWVPVVSHEWLVTDVAFASVNIPLINHSSPLPGFMSKS